MNLYKHKNNLDVAVEVLKMFYIKEKDCYSIKVEWWNVGKTHTPWSMLIKQRFKIDRVTWRDDWGVYNKER